MNNNKESGYPRLVLMTLLVVGLWGVVPTLAQMTRLPGGVTTALVNAFSALFLIIALVATGNGKILQLMKGHWKDFLALGFWWPLVYSVAFFHAIYTSDGSFASIMNAMWPIAAMHVLSRKGRHISMQTRLTVVVACSIAGVVLFTQNTGNDIVLPLLLGAVAAVTQGYFNAETANNPKYPSEFAMAILLTLVGALVAMVGGAVFALAFESYHQMISLGDIASIATIGVLSNGIGFTVFLMASQATQDSDNKTTTFWVIMSLGPAVQVGLSQWQSTGNLLAAPGYILAAGVQFMALLWYRRDKKSSKDDAMLSISQPSAD